MVTSGAAALAVAEQRTHCNEHYLKKDYLEKKVFAITNILPDVDGLMLLVVW